MISCTDFIPAYSEMFRYLEDNFGREEIDNYWRTMFKPGGGSPLVNFVTKEGIKGCFTYWKGTLNEEAAHFTMYLNEKRGFFKIVMHRCPSKGKLIDLRDQIGLEPYHDYCLHCDGYRAAVEQVGLEYIYDFTNMDNAGCSILIYDPKIFDGRVIMDEDTVIMDRNAADNEYFHPSFHFSLSRGMHYVGEHYGEKGVLGVMSRYVDHVVKPLMGEVTLEAIEQKILTDYAKEKCPDAVSTQLTADGLAVDVAYCPAIKYMTENDMWQSPWFRYTTQGVMARLAELAGCEFVMDHYDETTGAAKYRFIRK
ncbi:MAG: hypothetical protein IJP02_07555 [Oscillospiraceae bacterium]|nr:hypothetical protein [Oscillospiraceae bacterium]